MLHHHCSAGELLEGARLLAQVGQANGVVDGVVGTKVVAVGATCTQRKALLCYMWSTSTACVVPGNGGACASPLAKRSGRTHDAAAAAACWLQQLAQVRQANDVVDGVVGAKVIAVGATCTKGKALLCGDIYVEQHICGALLVVPWNGGVCASPRAKI